MAAVPHQLGRLIVFFHTGFQGSQDMGKKGAEGDVDREGSKIGTEK